MYRVLGMTEEQDIVMTREFVNIYDLRTPCEARSLQKAEYISTRPPPPPHEVKSDLGPQGAHRYDTSQPTVRAVVLPIMPYTQFPSETAGSRRRNGQTGTETGGGVVGHVLHFIISIL